VPTADSINDVLKDLDGKLPSGTISDFDESANQVTVATNNDKTGYSISGTKQTLDALNDVSTAQVNTEVDTALSDIALDHLVSAAVTGTDVADDSIIAQIVSKSATADWDTFDNTTDALEAIADAASGMTQQGVRDAMKLAPSGGAPAAGSVDEHLDDILADTNEIQGKLPTNNIMGSSVKTNKDDEIDSINSTVSTNLDATVSSRSDFDETSDQVIVATNNDKTGYSISGAKTTLDALNDISTAQVNTEVDTALSDIGLDHLISASVTGTDIVDDSIIAFMVSKSATADWDTFDNTTDSLEAIADMSAPSAAVIADAVWDELRTGHTTGGSFGEGVASVQGNVTGSVASVTGSVNSVTAQVTADITAISGDSTAADNLEADYDGTGYNKSASTIGTATNLTTNNDKTGYSISGAKTTLDALNDVSTAQVNAEVDTALSDIGLDHLVSAAVTGTDITDDSIIAFMVSKAATADWDTFNNTTDALEAIADAASGMTPQGVRDAMKLAPSGGVPAVDSVDEHLDDILADTNEMQGKLPTNNIMGSSVKTDKDDEIDSINSTVSTNLDTTVSSRSDFNEATDQVIVATNNDKTGYSISGAKTTLDALNDVSTAQVNTEVDTALSDIGLDHLISASVTGTDVIDNSIIAQMVSKSATADWDSFNNTTDALEAIADMSAPSAAVIADAVWDELRAGHTGVGSFGEGVTSVQGNVTGSVASVVGAVGSVTGSVGSVTGAVGSVTAPVTVGTNNDKTGYSISGTKTTLDALNDISTAEVNTEVDTALSDIGLDHLISVAVTGTDVADDSIIAQMVSKSATADWDSFNNTTDALEAIADMSAPSAAVIADAVWDELRAGHTGVGSFGEGQASVQGNVTGSVASVSGAVGSVTAPVTVGTNTDKTGYSISGSKTTLDALNDLSAAEVNTEVNDVINTDTQAELSSTPAANAPIGTKVNFIYMSARNKKDQTSSLQQLYKDDASTVLSKATVADVAGITTIGEFVDP
jgi:hypothetical protein